MHSRGCGVVAGGRSRPLGSRFGLPRLRRANIRLRCGWVGGAYRRSPKYGLSTKIRHKTSATGSLTQPPPNAGPCSKRCRIVSTYSARNAGILSAAESGLSMSFALLHSPPRQGPHNDTAALRTGEPRHLRWRQQKGLVALVSWARVTHPTEVAVGI